MVVIGMTGNLIWINWRGLCFGMTARNGRVVEAPPVAAWCLGKEERWVRRYWSARGASVVVLFGDVEDDGPGDCVTQGLD